MKRQRRLGLRGTRTTDDGKCALIDHVTIRDVKECAKRCGSHFFDRGNMRFFNSRIGRTAYLDGAGGAYFITSEQFVDHNRGYVGPRKYTVRHYSDCSIDTVGKHMSYVSTQDALAAIKRLRPRQPSLLGARRRR